MTYLEAFSRAAALAIYGDLPSPQFRKQTMKHIMFYALSIALCWTAVALLVVTYSESQPRLQTLAQQNSKPAEFGSAKVKELGVEPDLSEPSALLEEAEENDEIPVTIMQIPSPKPIAKPPKTGKDAAPPPMEI